MASRTVRPSIPPRDVVAARFVLDDVDYGVVPVWAAWWVVDGFDGPAMCHLAGLTGDEPGEVRDALLPALAEAGTSTPDLDTAVAAASSDMAMRCLLGEIGEQDLVVWAERTCIRFGYPPGLVSGPLGQLVSTADEWGATWGRPQDELRTLVRRACSRQLGESMFVGTPESLALVDQRLHDCWIDVPDGSTSDPPATLILTGSEAAPSSRNVVRSLGPVVRYVPLHRRLTISVAGVLECSVVDSAATGETCVDRVAWDEGRCTITIEGTMPVTIALRVARVEVEVARAEGLVPRRERWGLRRAAR